ncbi:hypothetical protein T06_1184 [Trichinella sp. T6]|nr:hypothetical protein T06_1184 [Trichinella sp. T6]
MEPVTIQVNRQMYTFVHPSSLSMCNGPIKSNPVFSNGNVSDVRIFVLFSPPLFRLGSKNSVVASSGSDYFQHYYRVLHFIIKI